MPSGAKSAAIKPQRKLVPIAQHAPLTSAGRVLPKSIIDYLTPGCVVRLCICDTMRNSNMEAIYFTITKIKDGTFWGTAMPLYRMRHGNYRDWGMTLFDVDLADGETFTWRAEHINEIPLEDCPIPRYHGQPWESERDRQRVQCRQFEKRVRGLVEATPYKQRMTGVNQHLRMPANHSVRTAYLSLDNS